MAELDDKVFDQIQSLCESADALADGGEYQDALHKYWEAYDLIPEPREEWEATLWVLGAIGDANFLTGDYTAARDNLSNAMHCPGAIGNPFLHLRLGQSQFELGNLDRAADELTRAYAVAGAEIFEEENPKYLAFLKTRISLQ
jgi:tetratricopeptide (TPR) repeat protein